jgi:predicted acylesterase/phospholipase RssA
VNNTHTAATNGPFRILALAGGGVRGIFQSSFLACLEQRTADRDLTAHFELIAGTSTGGILAIAIAAGVKPRRVRELYEGAAKEIFSTRPAAGLRRGPRYNSARLRRELEAMLGDMKLGDLVVPVVLPASNLETYTGDLLTSTDDRDVSAVEAALATAAAPTYFLPVAPKTGTRSYLDGGLWANDPSLVAILYAQHRLGLPIDQFRLLAVGTGTQPAGQSAAEVARLRTYSLATVDLLIEMTMASQAWFSREFVSQILSRDQYVNINPGLQRRIKLDDVARALALLPGLAEQQFDERRAEVERLLASAPNLVTPPPPPLDDSVITPLREAKVTAFYASRRDYQRFRPGAGTIDTYVGTATTSLKMISINLSTGILISGLLDRFREMICDREAPVSVVVSLIDPRERHLMRTLAPVLDTTAEELQARISETVRRLVEFRGSLPRRQRRYFESRVHSGLPPASAIMIDQNLPEGKVQLETKPYGAAMQESYALEVSHGSPLYGTLVASYERLLASGAPVRSWTAIENVETDQSGPS